MFYSDSFWIENGLLRLDLIDIFFAIFGKMYASKGVPIVPKDIVVPIYKS